jgi:hypothetical protein
MKVLGTEQRQPLTWRSPLSKLWHGGWFSSQRLQVLTSYTWWYTLTLLVLSYTGASLHLRHASGAIPGSSIGGATVGKGTSRQRAGRSPAGKADEQRAWSQTVSLAQGFGCVQPGKDRVASRSGTPRCKRNTSTSTQEELPGPCRKCHSHSNSDRPQEVGCLSQDNPKTRG